MPLESRMSVVASGKSSNSQDGPPTEEATSPASGHESIACSFPCHLGVSVASVYSQSCLVVQREAQRNHVVRARTVQRRRRHVSGRCAYWRLEGGPQRRTTANRCSRVWNAVDTLTSGCRRWQLLRTENEFVRQAFQIYFTPQGLILAAHGEA